MSLTSPNTMPLYHDSLPSPETTALCHHFIPRLFPITLFHGSVLRLFSTTPSCDPPVQGLSKRPLRSVRWQRLIVAGALPTLCTFAFFSFSNLSGGDELRSCGFRGGFWLSAEVPLGDVEHHIKGHQSEGGGGGMEAIGFFPHCTGFGPAFFVASLVNTEGMGSVNSHPVPDQYLLGFSVSELQCSLFLDTMICIR